MQQPPQSFLRFFQWYCHPKLLKYIEGDLMELYDEKTKDIREKKADLKFIVDVLLLYGHGSASSSLQLITAIDSIKK